MRCGREPGGREIAQNGVCPAAVEVLVDGINGGTNGGRACWAVSGTLCGSEAKGSFAARMSDCIDCRFYKQVLREEGEAFVPAITILLKLSNHRVR